ncbi:Protein CHUP1, chloroplastic [Apostasia shenzhenica]|uniref:Protein CHUP1, chloroplastic n=1 Tax=Apostasia shenzhenica TaxID=1088818 RepID=A0A2I0ADX6_9ASPA|nr:Protein CHUP1, chloroplastic [Apostasia shenzhenica]
MAGSKAPKLAVACFHRSPATPDLQIPPRSSPSPRSEKTLSSACKRSTFSLSFRAYFSRSTAKVQPRTSDVIELLRRVEDLQERESLLRTQLLEQKILKETVTIVPCLENEVDRCKQRIRILEAENWATMEEAENLRLRLAREEEEGRRKEKRVLELENEVEVLRRTVEQIGGSGRPKQTRLAGRAGVTEDRAYSPRLLPLIAGFNRCPMATKMEIEGSERKKVEEDEQKHQRCYNRSEEDLKPRSPRILRPPPKPSSTFSSSSSTESREEVSGVTVRPPPPPPPPPPMPAKRGKGAAPARVKRVPEVVELYQSIVRRGSKPDSHSSGASENGGSAASVTPNTKDMIGEIMNRSAHLLAVTSSPKIKTEVETQGEFIRELIKEVEKAEMRTIDDVVAFVEWLDEELSFLVDERAVLKHFDWPERKADALREAAFGYRDLKKLEAEAATFADDPLRPCAAALKKMQTLFEKLENAVFNLARARDGSMEIYRSLKIPWQWMLDDGIACQIKLASVKLAMKYMKRISLVLENAGSLLDEEELLLQGVRFAFRVHQFAGGFDHETMQAFKKLEVKARFLHNCSQRCRS